MYRLQKFEAWMSFGGKGLTKAVRYKSVLKLGIFSISDNNLQKKPKHDLVALFDLL